MYCLYSMWVMCCTAYTLVLYTIYRFWELVGLFSSYLQYYRVVVHEGSLEREETKRKRKYLEGEDQKTCELVWYDMVVTISCGYSIIHVATVLCSFARKGPRDLHYLVPCLLLALSFYCSRKRIVTKGLSQCCLGVCPDGAVYMAFAILLLVGIFLKI